MAGLFTIVVFLGGPLLDLLNELPGFSTSPIGRARAIWGFLIACLAGAGFERFLSSSKEKQTKKIFVYGIFAAAGIGMVVLIWWLRDVGTAAGHGHFVVKSAKISFMALLATASVWFLRSWLSKANLVGLVLLTIFLTEAWFFAVPAWPRIDKDKFYPTTAAHSYLTDTPGVVRMANDKNTLWAGSNTHWGINSVTSHGFHDDTYKELLHAFKQGAVPLTISRLDFDNIQQITHPILDHMAVSHAVLPVDFPVFGDAKTISIPNQDVVLPPGGAITFDLPGSGPIRGINLFSNSYVNTFGYRAALEVSVTDGETVVSTQRRFPWHIPIGVLQLAVAGEDFDSSAKLQVTISSLTFMDSLTLGVGDNGKVLVSRINPANDGLKLVSTQDAVIYERANSVPRYRWASSYSVLSDANFRLAKLAQPVEPGTVVLADEIDFKTSGAPAQILSVNESDPDVVTIAIEAEGNGLLVVADTLQDSWVAEVDGVRTDLIDADHAFVAVEVEAGLHKVVLRYSPPGFFISKVVSIIAAFIVLALSVLGIANRRAE